MACELCGRAIRRHQNCLSYGDERYRHYSCSERLAFAANRDQCPYVTHLFGGGVERCQFLGDAGDVERHALGGSHANCWGGLVERTWVLAPLDMLERWSAVSA